MCKYCEEQKFINEIEDNNPARIIEYGEIFLFYYLDVSIDVELGWEIKFCPMCGKKL